MAINDNLRDWIKQQESPGGKMILSTYIDSGGVPTAGYGHANPEQPLDTPEKVNAQLDADILAHTRMLDKDLTDSKQQLTENQYNAIASLIFNIGEGAYSNSTLRKKLQSGDVQGIAQEFEKWRFDNGKEVQGLLNRRIREKELFLGSNSHSQVPEQQPSLKQVFDSTDQLEIDTYKSPISEFIQDEPIEATNVYEPDFTTLEPVQNEPEGPTALESIAAVFRRENAPVQFGTGLALKQMKALESVVNFDETFNTQEALKNHPVLKDHQIDPAIEEDLLTAPNERIFNLIADRYIQQQKDKETVAQSPIWTQLVGGGIGAALDPTSYIGLGYLKGAQTATKLGAAAKGLLTGAGVFGTQSAAQEALLQLSDPTRTAEESTWNIALTAALGGTLNGTFQGLSHVDKAKQILNSEVLKGNTPVVDDAGNVKGFMQPDGSISAADAPVKDSTFAKTGLFRIPGVSQALDLYFRMHPGYRVRRQGPTFTKTVTDELGNKVNKDIYFKAGAEIADELEAARYLTEDQVKKGAAKPSAGLKERIDIQSSLGRHKIQEMFNEGYVQHSKASPTRLSRTAFEEQVSEASSALYWKESTEGLDEAAIKVAKDLQNYLNETVTQRRIKSGDLPEDIASNYHRFQLDKDKVLNNTFDFHKTTIQAAKRALSEKLRLDGVDEATIAKVFDRIEYTQKDFSKAINDLIDRLQVRGARVRGSGTGIQKKKGTFSVINDGKEYTVNLSDLPELKDYWSKDIKENSLTLLHKNIRDMEFKDLLRKKNNGVDDLTEDDLFKPIRRDLEDLRSKLTPEEFKQVKKHAEDVENDLKIMLDDILERSYLPPYAQNGERIMGTIRSFNRSTQLSNVMFTMPMDLPQMFKSMSWFKGRFDGLTDIIADAKIKKDIGVTAEELGLGFDRLFKDEHIAKFDISSQYKDQSAWSKGVRNFDHWIMKLTGMSVIDDVFRSANARIFSKEIMSRVKLATKRNIDWKKDPVVDFLKEWGIDENMFRRFTEEYSLHKNDISKWNSTVATEYRAAALHNANSTILRAGVGDTPNFTKAGFGAISAQYTNWAMAYNNRILAELLQKPLSPHAIQFAFIALNKVAVGTFMTMLQDKIAGRDPRSMEEYVKLGFMRTGVLGFGADMSTRTYDQLFGKYNFFTKGSDVVLGPTAGSANALKTVVQKGFQGDLDKNFWDNLQRTIPLGNSIYFQAILNRLKTKEKLGEKFGTPPKSRKKKGFND